MTSVIIVSDDPLVVQATRDLLHQQVLIIQLRSEIDAGLDGFQGPADREDLLLVLRHLARLIPAPREVSRRQGDPEGDWILDERNWCLRTPLGHDVQLQRAEAAILAKLFMRPGINQSREDLAASFKSDREDKNRSLDVAISKIRKKVRDASNLGLPLRSIRGVGYVFTGGAQLVSDFAQQS